MRYIKVGIVFFVFAIIVNFSFDFTLQQSSQTYHIKEYDISGIEIGLTNTNINIIETEQNNISIERQYSERIDKHKSIYTNYNKETKQVYIGEYLFDDKAVYPYQTIDILIPSSLEDISLKIHGEGNNVTISNAKFKTTTFSDFNNGVLDIENSKIDTIVFFGDNSQININTLNNLSTHIESTDAIVTLTNVISNEVDLVLEKGEVTGAENTINNLSAQEGDVDYVLNLFNDRNYSIITKSTIENENLISNEKGYEFINEKEKDTNSYIIDTTGEIQVNI